MAGTLEETKLEKLRQILGQSDSILVAFSGGVDSTFLIKVSRDVLGDGVLAVTAASPTFPEADCQEAIEIAESLGVEHIIIHSRELEDPAFTCNGPDRCFHCKSGLFSELIELAGQKGIDEVADATNADDYSDFRPGIRAARELGVISPLADADLAKAEIRELSHQMGLATWDKPASACLASRFPYGEEITAEKLTMVSRAEDFLRGLGVRVARVRYHGSLCRIEMSPGDFDLIVRSGRRKPAVDFLKGLGFTYVALDIEGYRTGSMNEVLPAEDKDGSSNLSRDNAKMPETQKFLHGEPCRKIIPGPEGQDV